LCAIRDSNPEPAD